MKSRWISAGIGIPLYLGLCVWGAKPFAAGMTLLAAIGLMELLRAFRAQGIFPNPLVASLGVLVPALGAYASPWRISYEPYLLNRMFLAFAAVLFAALFWEIVRAARTGEMRAGQRLAYGLLCGLYVSLFGGLAWLRHWPNRIPNGMNLVLTVTLCVWATDTFAFFIGRQWGKRKLAPALSPNKTVAGAVGGFIGSVIVGAVCGWLFWGRALDGLAIGVIAGVAGQAGDLFESALKRELGIKDFGGLLPGHGGVLDRFDSLLFVASLMTALIFPLAISIEKIRAQETMSSALPSASLAKIKISAPPIR